MLMLALPVIDLKSANVLTQIEDAYTTVGFAVFTNALDTKDQTDMNCWFDEMKSFFEFKDVKYKPKHKNQEHESNQTTLRSKRI